MRCGYADCSWEFWGLDFGVYVSEICLFLCSSLMRIFVVQVFSISRTVCGWLRSLDEFKVVPIINSTVLAIVAEADLCSGDFLSEKIVVTNW